jgi:hypothetical protein
MPLLGIAERLGIIILDEWGRLCGRARGTAYNKPNQDRECEFHSLPLEKTIKSKWIDFQIRFRSVKWTNYAEIERCSSTASSTTRSIAARRFL